MRRKAWAGSPLLFFGPPLYVEDASTWGIEAPLLHPDHKGHCECDEGEQKGNDRTGHYSHGDHGNHEDYASYGCGPRGCE